MKVRGICLGVYKTLEVEIKELWASRELEVIEEKFRKVSKDTFEWTITARRKR